MRFIKGDTYLFLFMIVVVLSFKDILSSFLFESDDWMYQTASSLFLASVCAGLYYLGLKNERVPFRIALLALILVLGLMLNYILFNDNKSGAEVEELVEVYLDKDFDVDKKNILGKWETGDEKVKNIMEVSDDSIKVTYFLFGKISDIENYYFEKKDSSKFDLYLNGKKEGDMPSVTWGVKDLNTDVFIIEWYDHEEAETYLHYYERSKE